MATIPVLLVYPKQLRTSLASAVLSNRARRSSLVSLRLPSLPLLLLLFCLDRAIFSYRIVSYPLSYRLSLSLVAQVTIASLILLVDVRVDVR